MFNTIKNAFKIKELRKKILYTLFMLLIFRLCCYIPTPFIDTAATSEIVEKNGLLGLIDVITGGSLANYTFMAMGISPYINASIILQLLTVVIPKLQDLQKEGPEGRKKINKITRYTSIGLALVQAIGICISMQNAIVESYQSIAWFCYIVIGIVLSAGTALAIWIGERITEKGIGNGISLLIFIGIVSRLPAAVSSYISVAKDDSRMWWYLIPVIAAIALVIVVIVLVELGERRIPVQYAKRVTGRKVYGGASTYMPIKPNGAGVLPLIFAMAFMTFPSILIQMFWANTGFAAFYNNWLGSGTWVYAIVSVVLIIAFAFFYASISFNPEETASDIQKYGGFIQGIRPGKPTADYLKKVNRRFTLFAGIYLAVIAVIPMIVSAIMNVSAITNANAILKLALTFGSTGILIMVSVSIEMVKQLESQMVMNHYKGFLD
ncbi:MAG: preprotein translocase subunit SecY [Firmicutes bacterium]|nr:preprotein translocase subunit SecY [Bacillota bacterium]